MKERPILFSAPMVRALLAGTKTQTRRVLKGSTEHRGPYNPDYLRVHQHAPGWAYICPYGRPGDRLWVRETWREWSDTAWHYAADGLVRPRQRDHELAAFLVQRAPFTWESYNWRPSIFMPRAASRITLEVTGVRVERLQDISSADAIAEGIEACPRGGEWRDYLDSTRDMLTPRNSYRSLWESINGPGSWDANPWVWVIEFKRAD